MENVKLKCVKKNYVDKNGVEKVIYNYRLYYTDTLYINVKPSFDDDYFTLNSLRRKGLIEYETPKDK